MFHVCLFFQFSASSRFLLDLPWGLPDRQCPLFGRFAVLWIITRSVHLSEIRGTVCITKSQTFCVSFSRMHSGLCIYHLFIWSNLNFLHNSQWITFPIQSFLILCSFWANLLHLLIIWLIVSSHSRNNLHQLFCCVLSIFFDILIPYGVVLSCYRKRFSFSLKASFS